VNLRIFLVVSIEWMIIMLVVYYVGAYIHESVHQHIFAMYGFNSTIVLNTINNPYTVTTTNVNMTKEDYYNMNRLNTENDIAGYNNVILEMLCGFILYFIMIKVGNDVMGD